MTTGGAALLAADRSRYVSLAEAREALGCGKITLWRWLQREGIQTRAFVGDNRRFIRREDLERLMGGRVIGPRERAG